MNNFRKNTVSTSIITSKNIGVYISILFYSRLSYANIIKLYMVVFK